MPGGNAVALFPEETLYLFLEGKLAVPEAESASKLVQMLCKFSQAQEFPATFFTTELFALYSDLRSHSYLVRREVDIVESLSKLDPTLSLSRKKKKTEPAAAPAEGLDGYPGTYAVYGTKEAMRAGKPEFRVTLAPKMTTSISEIETFARKNVKLAVVRESKVVMLDIAPL